MTQYLGGTRHFFLLTLYNFKNIGGGGQVPPAPRSLSVECIGCTAQVSGFLE